MSEPYVRIHCVLAPKPKVDTPNSSVRYYHKDGEMSGSRERGIPSVRTLYEVKKEKGGIQRMPEVERGGIKNCRRIHGRHPCIRRDGSSEPSSPRISHNQPVTTHIASPKQHLAMRELNSFGRRPEAPGPYFRRRHLDHTTAQRQPLRRHPSAAPASRLRWTRHRRRSVSTTRLPSPWS